MAKRKLNLRKVAAITACLAVTTMFSDCGKDDPKENLRYVKTELGGCNLQQPDLERGDLKMDGDTTVTITISGDSVNVFVNLYYQCKLAPFETEVKTIDDVMYMYITDLCDNFYDDVWECYARCMCNYTFDFIFTHNGEINQKYKILLIDPREENPIIISEGIIQ